MSIPPFPSQDLAKLVLGYLAEEQLMTAYDEFLQASPYLDVLRNEYDRIFMTSLKNILAEYRAVKIYVETCKPFALRRRLFGCTNLLEVVKFLVDHIDVNKLNVQETTADRVSSDSRNTTFESKSNSCAVCNSLKLASCVCRNRNISRQATSIQSASHLEVNSSESSVDTTALEDLPGTHVATRRKVRVLEKESKVSLSTSAYENTEICQIPQAEPTSVKPEQNPINTNAWSSQMTYQHNNMPQSIDVRNAATMEPSQKIVELSEVLSVASNNTTDATKCSGKSVNKDNVNHSRVSTAGTFQDFATGVNGNESRNNIVPDSSTSENFNVVAPPTKETNITSSMTHSIVSYNEKPQTNAHIFLKVGMVKNNSLVSQSNNQMVPVTKTNTCAGVLRPKMNDHKITILSDIKVDKTLSKNNHPKIPAVLKNATSTPLMQMQTIVINDTPVYKQESQHESNRNFTKDEIMAMPTIIVVPSPGPSPRPGAHIQRLHPAVTSSVCTNSRSLEPLVIDVSSNSTNTVTTISNMPALQYVTSQNNNPQYVTSQNNNTDLGMLVKTVDMKNASVPKDNVVNMETTKSTPQMQPPLRKASSTPRRTGHVRVLDFTTPRRILEETIIEHTSNQGSDSDIPVEVIVSQSPNLHSFVDTTCSENVEPCDKNIINSNTNSLSIKEKNPPNIIQNKKYNWDADLRALAVANENDNKSSVQKTKPKCKKRKAAPNSKANVANKTMGKSDTNLKRSNQKRKSTEAVEEVNLIEDKVSAPVKPTINIITGPDWSTPQVNDKSQNKSNEDTADTPEMDRVSLQNAIGAKLNISDLLETPYKQALYDIQMETPRFLGPDLPGEPLSDIKIMNIPTPRFLNTPKPVVATPSSYSSRPTDYSSGGSYYKPDDQDYMPIEEIEYPITSSKENNNPSTVEVPEIGDCKDKASSVKTRPVRNCTKNVSYFNHKVSSNKTKEADDNMEATSTCSESMSVHSSNETLEDNKKPKPTKETKPRISKSETKKKNIQVKKRKTPVKKDPPKSFMKIKPRRPTPSKDNSFGRKKKAEAPARKRTNSKEKNLNVTPTVTCAPTKSRRKSSTPRKLHCTKTFNSESSGHNSPDLISATKQNVIQESNLTCPHDSDTEQLPLRWSDDGSRDAKSPEIQINNSANEPEDILKIKEFIADTDPTNIDCKERESNLHVDLVKRGFDIETAKIIERDLLDTPPHTRESATVATIPILTEINSVKAPLEKEKSPHPQSSTSASLPNTQDEEEEIDEVELSVHECNQDTDNYISYQHDDTKEIPEKTLTRLKDKFSVEVCIDDGVAIRLRATPFTVLLDQDPDDVTRPDYAYRETEMAVDSISHIDKLYTPMKDPVRAQCYEIFDSTLTSLDTPLKVISPKRNECQSTIAEIVLEVEKIEDKEKTEPRKRKRLHSGDVSDDSTNETKRPRPEPHLLLQSAHIQNIDIETVLYKLHGP